MTIYHKKFIFPSVKESEQEAQLSQSNCARFVSLNISPKVIQNDTAE